jgi:HSP20 family protein
LASKERRVEIGKDETPVYVSRRTRDYISDMDRMLDDFRNRFESTLFPFVDPWMSAGRTALGMPQVRHAYTDLIDAGKEYRVMVEVPGIPKDTLDVTITSRDIKIEGESKTDSEQKEEGYVRRERGFSKIQTSLTFPEEVLPDTAAATVNNGMLEVRVAKKMPTEVKRQKVSVA